MTTVSTRRILLGDTDAAGIAFTGRLIDVALETLEQGMCAIGIDFAEAIRTAPVISPIVRVESDFLRPLRHGDDCRCELVCERIGTTSYTTRVDLVHAASNTVAARVHITAACIDRTAFTPVPVPDAYRAALMGLMPATP